MRSGPPIVSDASMTKGGRGVYLNLEAIVTDDSVDEVGVVESPTSSNASMTR